MALFEDAFINAAGTACSIVGYVLIVVLFLFGMTYTIKTKGVQFRMIKESVRLTFSGLAGEAVKKKNTFVSSFQAFCVSMGARIGVGNIAGVAIAIMTGGPGAIFWMWLFAIIGAATSFVECTIGQIYKERQNDGLYHGGPAYYI
ncbi:MAG TPA: alanine:cation symporter family protein, partial [Methanocorpusculum sp.]|nr:alanine:cation symporter family protein [Methanocorpusculum sp.]